MNKRSIARSACIILLLPLLFFAPLGKADAPPGHFTVSTEIVVDNFTRLTWQRASSAVMTSSEAAALCAALTLAGSTEWRLPSIKELQTIVDETRTSPAIDTTAFPDTPAEEFWSSSNRVNSGTVIATVDFNVGNTSGANFTMGMARTRCVH